jgi:hypothetical protein
MKNSEKNNNEPMSKNNEYADMKAETQHAAVA